ncbi:leucine-rich repeats and immunoglobulin-like domains protein 1 [Elysia marginata]|uniref:Leucine-rich repeats and immunoglobulin-like domains protein 1 n=1 Tax=Elysia marginata TaxID=1093978 RepID=A0AAV4GKX5_9GAST|nr:leucine-rich repeats and immunoglobulin-like domains protein 1 [Elysia marginata]
MKEDEVRMTLKGLFCCHDIRISGTNFPYEGGLIQLVCTANRTAPSLEHIDWFRNGNKLTTDLGKRVNISMRYTFEGSIQSILAIKPATISDSGDYVCRASNNNPVLLRVNVLGEVFDEVLWVFQLGMGIGTLAFVDGYF